VSVAALPNKLKTYLKERYEVFDESGKRCEVKPTGFQLMVHVIPHFGTVNFWEGRLETEEPDPKKVVPEAARALNLWSMVAGGPYQMEGSAQGLTLGIEMDPNTECKNPVWGRVITETSSAPWIVRAPNPEETVELKEAVASHPVVLGLNAQSKKSQGGTGDWFETVRADSLRVITSGTGTVLMYAEASGVGGCAYDEPTSAGLLFRRKAGVLVPLLGELHPEGFIRAAVDIDGDGEVELIAETSILSKAAKGYVHAVDLFPLYLDCPC
jgi:hypothetical protein